MLGLVLLAMTTDIVTLNLGTLTPIILILIGGWLLLHPRGTTGRVRMSGSAVEVTSIFGDRKVRADSSTLERASLTSLFGDLHVNLTDAEPSHDMVADIAVLIGDVDLTVPASWRVDVSPSSLVGDVKHLPPPEPASTEAPHFRVRGFTALGDITVRQ